MTDLAPMYHDGVASEASRRLVKEHLKKCTVCRRYYRKYRPAAGVQMETPVTEAADFILLAKKMRRRRALLWSGFLTYVGATMTALVLYFVKTMEK